MIDLAALTLAEMLTRGEKVLVHCAAGQSRSPLIAAKALSIIEKKDIKEIYEELFKLLPNIKNSLMYGFVRDGYIK